MITRRFLIWRSATELQVEVRLVNLFYCINSQKRYINATSGIFISSPVYTILDRRKGNPSFRKYVFKSVLHPERDENS